MMSFLSQFSSSFLLALLAWPFVAALLTLPILIWQYRRYNKLTVAHSLAIYTFILYLLGLASFTLYPMPDNAAEFCRAYTITPQLIPFTFITDIAQDGVRAALQVAMNVAFFLPLGVFANVLLRWRFIPMLIGAFFVSLLIETAQLTGAFGFYPCSYRLFDVDDLLFNTLGAILGFWLAALFPKKPREIAGEGAVVTHPGLVRRLVGFTIDQVTLWSITVFITLGIYLLTGSNTDLATGITQALTIPLFVVLHFIIPYVSGGRTAGGLAVRMRTEGSNQFDRNTPSGALQRLAFYILRLAFIASVLFAPYGLNILLVVFAYLFWRKKKRVLWDIKHK